MPPRTEETLEESIVIDMIRTEKCRLLLQRTGKLNWSVKPHVGECNLQELIVRYGAASHLIQTIGSKPMSRRDCRS
jgi:hypothetical protein